MREMWIIFSTHEVQKEIAIDSMHLKAKLHEKPILLAVVSRGQKATAIYSVQDAMQE